LSKGIKFELLSDNAILIINEILDNQRLLKLIHYGDDEPLEQIDITNPGGLVLSKIFPTPFFEDVPEVESIQLRVFFDYGTIQNGHILGSNVVFQIIIPNAWWTIRKENGALAVRPYLIKAELVNQFEGKSISTAGVLRFVNFKYGYVNEHVTAYELIADMMTL